MKKLVVIIMVLAMASIATAGAVWDTSYDAGSLTATIILKGTDVSTFSLGNPSIMNPGGGDFAGLAVSPSFEANPMVTFAGMINMGSIFNAKGGFTSPGTTVTDDLWSATYTWAAAPVADVTFDVSSAAYYKAGTSSDQVALGDFTVVIPEPMTMALLGLGGLFLRRRK